MKLDVVDAYDRRAETIWRALEAAARPSYFLSWAWIENWLACLPRELAPELAVIVDGDAPVAAGFIGRRREVRHRVLASRSLHLNATGVDRYDELCVEHNGLVRAAGARVTIGDLVDLLLPGAWDELRLHALDTSELPIAPARGYRVVVDRETLAPFVNLARVREADYLGLLGADTRAQIRRARRGLGDIRVEVAADPAHAMHVFDELVALHNASWRARGQTGAFADAWFTDFHRRLIEQRFAHGEIQLIRVAATTTVGCLYNLVSHNRVLFYQSGFAAFDDPRIKPGYVCHAAAVELNAAAGHVVYDLLGGGRRYKRSLATDEVKLASVRIQRPRARFVLEDRLRRALHAWSARS
jgi:CelD/BcsL family acetyltransferase involved in cellulose biosynthesis